MNHREFTGFTPVRRKEGTVNHGRTQADQEQEWTAARCHRLLRALTSRVAILNKEISKYSTGNKTCDKPTTKATFPLSNTRTLDGDWAHPKKKVKQTYAGRGRGRGNGVRESSHAGAERAGRVQYDGVPGDIIVPTPLLVRARGENAALPSFPESPLQAALALDCRRKKRDPRTGYLTDSYSLGWKLTGTLYDLRRKVDSTRFSAYEGIYTGLEALIRLTVDEEPEKKRKGARSLFSTALKSVPQYISHQEELLDSHMVKTNSKSAITSRNISMETYDDLESLGTSGKHWKHLKTVVRSHGIQIITIAIEDKLLDSDICAVLISFLVEAQAFDEADSIMAALLDTMPFNKPKTLYDMLDKRISMLVKYSTHTKRFKFQYKQLAHIFEEGRLSELWLATKGFGQIWTTLFQHMSSDYLSTAIPSTLLHVILPALASATILKPENKASINITFAEAAKNTFLSLLATISSLFILSDEARNLDRFAIIKSFGYEKLVPLLRSCTLGLNLLDMRGSPKVILLLSRTIVEAKSANSDCDSGRLLLEMLHHDKSLDISTILHDLATLVCSIAQCCGKGASTSGFDYLQELHLTLESVIENIPQSGFLATVVVDSAYEFAQKNSDQQHLQYASMLDSRYASRLTSLSQTHDSAVSGDQHTGFRWEEGIGEWVTATPAVKLARRQNFVPLTIDEDGDCETPHRPCFRNKSSCTTTQPHTPAVSSVAVVVVQPKSIPAQIIEGSDTDLELEPDISGSQSSAESLTEATETSDVESVDTKSSPMDEDRDLRPRKCNSQEDTRAKRRSLRNCPSRVYFSSPSSVKSYSPPSTPYTDDHVQERSQVKPMVIINQKIIHPQANAKRQSRNSSTWTVFDESDDELSFISESSQSSQASSQESRAMREMTNKRPIRPRLVKAAGKENVKQKPPTTLQLAKLRKRRFVDYVSDDSEDELCC